MSKIHEFRRNDRIRVREDGFAFMLKRYPGTYRVSRIQFVPHNIPGEDDYRKKVGHSQFVFFRANGCLIRASGAHFKKHFTFEGGHC